jgi:N-acetylglutamate synthase-like GNAT family acetyltransferase
MPRGTEVERVGSADFFRIDFLADHDNLVPELAALVWRWWGFPSEREAAAQLRREAHRDGVPSVHVALRDEEALGMVSLIECNLEQRSELYPWLAGLFVRPQFRCRGIGSALTFHLEQDAERLGIRGLYLYTTNAERFYQRLGWRTIERFDGEPIAIMSKALPRRLQ